VSNSTVSIIKKIAGICLSKKIIIAVAESCTGGMLASALTSIPGSSRWFDCGIVSYSNSSKTALLGVNPALITNYGAVSEQVALQMSLSKSFATNIEHKLVIAITGIAGPEGGTDSKPVGTVCFACIAQNYQHVETKIFYNAKLNRSSIRRQAVLHALNMLVLALDNL
jgi:nicotinamide-nucleotide amidase